MKRIKGVSERVLQVQKEYNCLRFGSELEKEKSKSRLRGKRLVDEECFSCSRFLPNTENESGCCYGNRNKGGGCLIYQPCKNKKGGHKIEF